MSRRIVRTSLATVLLFLSVGAGAMAAGVTSLTGLDDSIVPSPDVKRPHAREFKLKGAGQIDVSTFTLDFSGKASSIGKYVGTGQVDPSTFQIQGMLTASDDRHCAVGEQIYWTAAFQQGPLGDIVATFTFSGGTGRFVNASGSASGPVVLDPDYMFTINLAGTITY
jgi:hypothetical protein